MSLNINPVQSVKRALTINLSPGKSAFLWGPRKTGKTTLLEQLFPESTKYDLLETDTYTRLLKEPFRLREELILLKEKNRLQEPVIIDEVQKIPSLLDEIHWLIEKKKITFLLCGSSARKLKKTQANMLGGRAWRFELFPLTYAELGSSFDLLQALNQGLIPSHYLDDKPQRTLKAYVQDYLKEEIQMEGLVRNLPAFAKFLDVMSFSIGSMVNFANISRECGVDAKTVAEYYQILQDTLLGTFLMPFHKQKKRQLITKTPKFYLFDVGVAGFLCQRTLNINKGEEFGKAFEHFIFMELLAYRAYKEREASFYYWHTKENQEVDFVIETGKKLITIEVKSSSHIDRHDLIGLNIFIKEHQPHRACVVCQETRSRKLEGGIEVIPWKKFLQDLWSGDFF